MSSGTIAGGTIRSGTREGPGPVVTEEDTEYSPTAQQEALSSRWCKVVITKVDNGFILRIGCKKLVANTWLQVSSALDTYWKDPSGAEAKYCNK